MEFSLEDIKKLMDAFEERNMHKLQLKKGDFEIVVERTAPAPEVIHAAPMMEQMSLRHTQSHVLPAHFPSAEKAIEHKPEVVEAPGKFVTSPMVGTFYMTPSPQEPAFVKVGDSVKVGDVLCIIEAMKVMNEVKSTENGIVKAILVDNAHPVEFGTKLFKIG